MSRWPALRTIAKRLVRTLMERPESSEGLSNTLVVRRGLSPDFYFFLQIFAKQRGTYMVLDRRVGDRRRLPRDIGTERRRNDRRGAVPSTWSEGNFVCVRDSHIDEDNQTDRLQSFPRDTPERRD